MKDDKIPVEPNKASASQSKKADTPTVDCKNPVQPSKNFQQESDVKDVTKLSPVALAVPQNSVQQSEQKNEHLKNNVRPASANTDP